MEPITPERLIELGFSFLEANKYYRIAIGNTAFGVVLKGGTWMCSPIPMQFASLLSVSTIEDIDGIIFAGTGQHLVSR
ncbi:hypothetical protein [Chitinophaga japonensis]|uniref:Uncharacterized protein n=1 Tax=Chitinophaga japonensis TaxID=104662 RepID=A0A562T719_CHIJA|nr:hypothetical protein [Chitinophaga japonensis]TWI89153.1 hypothetical protein LX66_3247 [Chitinophaga japonensis]